jgi:crossover junction endodeoxyribonuclease RusA
VMLTLPYPPSANTYWRRKGHQYFIAAAGKAFRTEVEALCRSMGLRPLAGPVALTVTLTPGDRRRRDIDNVLKPLLDALTHGGAWTDDSQVKRLIVAMGEPEPKRGRCMVTLSQVGMTEGA